MDDAKVVDDVLGLEVDRDRVVRERETRLTVSMKKQVSTASHCPACGSLSSVHSAPYISSKSPGTVL